MKRFFTVSGILATLVLAASMPLFAQVGQGRDRTAEGAQAMEGSAPAAEGRAKVKDVSYVGWIVDEWCGAKNANADGKTCAMECHQKGAKLVLYVPASKTTIVLDDQKAAAKNVGAEVRVKGMMEGETLKVSSIEATTKG